MKITFPLFIKTKKIAVRLLLIITAAYSLIAGLSMIALAADNAEVPPMKGEEGHYLMDPLKEDVEDEIVLNPPPSDNRYSIDPNFIYCSNCDQSIGRFWHVYKDRKSVV